MGVISTDLNPNAFVGLSLPFEVSNNGDFQKTKTLIEQTRSNIKNLLLTAKGERPMHPTFGSNLRAVLFEPFTNDISDKKSAFLGLIAKNTFPYSGGSLSSPPQTDTASAFA